ncbi:hypothetical protein [Bifidobacterium myosotis]|uniref:Uncharacterized protein n=1 Tax=Bifidobacterium myosotis TaxID=1630166 RepID=A0A5M9ZH96_9BIFI|nr:hypothetical protein [Bifidobacterium myosotis]KAA8826991.1 hypothetical protein EMO91_10710 [Bifidobacterium myosotis]
MGGRLIGLYSPFADPVTRARQLTAMMYGINGHIADRAEVARITHGEHRWTEAEIDEVLDNLHAVIARAEEEKRRREEPEEDYMGAAREWRDWRREEGYALTDTDWLILKDSTKHDYTAEERALIESGD